MKQIEKNDKNKKINLPKGIQKALFFFLMSAGIMSLSAKEREGIVLYKIDIASNAQRDTTITRIAIDTTGDGVEDTFLGLGPDVMAQVVANRRIKEGSVIIFDDAGARIDAEGYLRIALRDVKTIDGIPANPNQGR